MKLKAKILSIFLFLFTTLFYTPQIVHAQPLGLSIVPPRFELFANPGDLINESIKVSNRSDVPQTFGIIIEDFSSAGEEGHVVLEEDESDTQYSLKSWIETSSQNLVVQPNEEVSFPFSIIVPKDAEPGGHYASILFQIGGEPIEGVTNVQHRVGALVLLRVSGNVEEEGLVESFSAPAYSKSGPVNFELRVKNNGTTHIRPNGTIIITNLFGKKIEEIPLNGLNVFPGVIRKMETEWTRENILGHYTATLVATYGQQNLPLTAAVKFTVISPISAVLLIVGALAALIFALSIISGRNRLIRALKVLAGK
ncbi:hypothetical protein ACFL2V_20400 [Pseudomonadota bacterium]